MRLLALSLLPLCLSCGQNASQSCVPMWKGFHASNDREFWREQPVGVTSPIFHRVKVHRSGSVTWNGHSPDYLAQNNESDASYIKLLAQMTPQPFVMIDFDEGADCVTINRLRSAIDEQFDCEHSNRCLQGSVNPYDQINPDAEVGAE